MKSPAGRTRPVAKRVRLDLRRAAPPPPPEDEMTNGRRSNFWTWFSVVALFHIAVLVLVLVLYHPSDTPPPTPPFFSLMPQGDLVKGTPGAQTAAKVGASTPAPAHHRHHLQPKPVTLPPVTPPPAAAQVQPPPKPIDLKPVIPDETAPVVAQVKPKPPKPVPPKPKIKVDLHLADGPTPDQPVTNPKHVKKTPPRVADDSSNDPDQDDASRQTMGLSKDEVAARLGKKLQEEGVSNATQVGKSGLVDGHDNPFGDFYQSISDQIQEKWQRPNQDVQNETDPVVRIHVESDGRVPPESVVLLSSSGNQVLDDSALSAARSIGHTLQPLPDGCPPDISINLKIAN